MFALRAVRALFVTEKTRHLVYAGRGVRRGSSVWMQIPIGRGHLRRDRRADLPSGSVLHVGIGATSSARKFGK